MAGGHLVGAHHLPTVNQGWQTVTIQHYATLKIPGQKNPQGLRVKRHYLHPTEKIELMQEDKIAGRGGSGTGLFNGGGTVAQGDNADQVAGPGPGR